MSFAPAVLESLAKARVSPTYESPNIAGRCLEADQRPHSNGYARGGGIEKSIDSVPGFNEENEGLPRIHHEHPALSNPVTALAFCQVALPRPSILQLADAFASSGGWGLERTYWKWCRKQWWSQCFPEPYTLPDEAGWGFSCSSGSRPLEWLGRPNNTITALPRLLRRQLASEAPRRPCFCLTRSCRRCSIFKVVSCSLLTWWVCRRTRFFLVIIPFPFKKSRRMWKAIGPTTGPLLQSYGICGRMRLLVKIPVSILFGRALRASST